MGVTVEIQDSQVRVMLAAIATNTRKISERSSDYVGLLSAIVFRDLIHHFEQQQGPDGKWQRWSDGYRNKLIKKGKGGNLILQDTGRLKGGWQPTRYRLSREGVLWYNPVEYGEKHQRGQGVPKRQFAWISDRAVDSMVDQTHKFLGFD